MTAITFLILAAVLAVLALWLVPRWQVRRVEALENRIRLTTEARRTLAQILGGAALLVGLYFTAQEIRIRQEAQIAQTLAQAAEMLGADDIGVRVSAIYALEQIAKGSNVLNQRMTELLAAYLRENTARNNAAEEDKGDHIPEPRSDIKAALTVLKRLTRTYENGGPLYLDLREVDITRADLAGAFLEGANLEGAKLKWANRTFSLVELEEGEPRELSPVYLSGANLDYATLTGSNLKGADLKGASIRKAKLRSVYLDAANLEEADLGKGTDLTGSRLRRTNLLKANLERAQMEGANMIEADLRDASLQRANLMKANLWRAQLQRANLTEANLRDARLIGADLTGAILARADIGEADLRNAIGLTKEQIESATRDDSTMLPDPTVPFPVEYEDNFEYEIVVVFETSRKQIALEAVSALTKANFEASAMQAEKYGSEWALDVVRKRGPVLLIGGRIPEEKVALIRDILSPFREDQEIPVWNSIESFDGNYLGLGGRRMEFFIL